MKKEINKNILSGIQKLLIEADLDIYDIDYILYALNNGEISRSIKLTLESLKCVLLYDENINAYKEKNKPYNINVQYILKISSEKNIPFSRVFSFIRSIGFNDFRNNTTIEGIIDQFLKTSDTKSISKLLDFIHNYSGDSDPYLNSLENAKK